MWAAVQGAGVVGDLRLFPVLPADFHGLFDLGAREHRGGCWQKTMARGCQGKKTRLAGNFTLTLQRLSSNREAHGGLFIARLDYHSTPTLKADQNAQWTFPFSPSAT